MILYEAEVTPFFRKAIRIRRSLTVAVIRNNKGKVVTAVFCGTAI